MFRWRLSRPERALRGAELFCDVQFPDKPGRSAGTVQQLPVAGHQKAYFFRGISPAVPAGNGKAQTAEVLKDGWLYTGDMAMQDKDGFYFLVDRKKDVVVSGGENIYPVQIEDFLRTNDKIKDVAVIGLPDKRLGEICGAVIELKPGVTCTEEEIQDFCMDLPRYKRPRKIIFAEIPRNATGKIEKPALRKRYGAEHLVAQQNRS